jgi:hypothetical protein
MKATFSGWYTKTPEELSALWASALIVPDANILLHLLRHSADVRTQLMDVFERKKDALWIPYQVGLEFQRRRLDVQQHALEAYDKVFGEIAGFANQAKNKLNQYRAHPVIDVERELMALDAYTNDFRNRIEHARSTHPAEELAASFERVTALFDGKVGIKQTEVALSAIRKEGEERYAKKIPPGFEDAKKTEGDKFGDLIIWKAMLEKSKADNRSIIFVTDDGKSDWWYSHRGKKMGPHPLLTEEFLAITGQQFHIYELPQFLRFAIDSGSTIKAETVQQIADTLVADSEALFTRSVAIDRARTAKALRQDLTQKESELDGLINSLINYPPQTATPSSTGDDVKQGLRLRIAELNTLVNALRDQLGYLESELPSSEGKSQ